MSNVLSLVSHSSRWCTQLVYCGTRFFVVSEFTPLEEELQITASSWALKDVLIMKSVHSMYNMITYIWILMQLLQLLHHLRELLTGKHLQPHYRVLTGESIQTCLLFLELWLAYSSFPLYVYLHFAYARCGQKQKHLPEKLVNISISNVLFFFFHSCNSILKAGIDYARWPFYIWMLWRQ